MKIYGYSKLKVTADGLIEMREVSIQTGPDNLRRIAQFINQCAELMEKHGEKFGHEHLKDHYVILDDNFPDIIVAKSRA